MIYTGSAAGACIDDVNGASCSAGSALASTSDRSDVLRGTVANGAACSAAEACASGLCENLIVDESGAVTTRGTCTAKLQDCAACLSGSSAAVGSECVAGA